MSWTFSIAAVAKEGFAAAVDAAEAAGQPLESVGLAEDVAAAKDALKSLASRVKRTKVSGAAHGHCLQSNEGNNWYDGISVSVSGVD